MWKPNEPAVLKASLRARAQCILGRARPSCQIRHRRHGSLPEFVLVSTASSCRFLVGCQLPLGCRSATSASHRLDHRAPWQLASPLRPLLSLWFFQIDAGDMGGLRKAALDFGCIVAVRVERSRILQCRVLMRFGPELGIFRLANFDRSRWPVSTARIRWRPDQLHPAPVPELSATTTATASPTCMTRSVASTGRYGTVMDSQPSKG